MCLKKPEAYYPDKFSPQEITSVSLVTIDTEITSVSGDENGELCPGCKAEHFVSKDDLNGDEGGEKGFFGADKLLGVGELELCIGAPSEDLAGVCEGERMLHSAADTHDPREVLY